MAWRIVKQPNGKLARFSDVVDDFTHYDMDRRQALDVCIAEGLSPDQAEEKVKRGEVNPQRFLDELHTIELVHGVGLRQERERELS